MKVYIKTGEPYHDNSTIYGVYDSLEKAETSEPTLKWRRDGGFGSWGAVSEASVRRTHIEHVLIYEFEVS